MSQPSYQGWDVAILCKTILSKQQCIYAKGTTDKAMRQTSQACIYSTLPLKRRHKFVQMYAYTSIMWCICGVHCCYCVVEFLLIISILHHRQSQQGYTKYDAVILRSLTHTHNKKLILTQRLTVMLTTDHTHSQPLILVPHSQSASWLASPF